VPLHIRTIVSMPFDENTYVVWLPQRPDALVIDPGFQPEEVLDFLREQELTVAAILNTHGHADHIAGNAALKEAFPQAPVLIGRDDAAKLTDAQANLSASFGFAVTSPPADRTLVEGDVLEEGGIRLEVLHLPGHSPGHVVYLYRDQPCFVFSGDALFRGSIGRDDFPGGDGRLLISGIRKKLLSLPPDTVIYPGHGPATQVAYEQRTNPFLQ
jgi:glyoxylase-like metal-dependent hydrolase (beta-lactamase superfamily II)